MRILRIAWLLCIWNVAEAKELPPFEVESVISKPVKALGKPQWWPEIVSWKPAVSTSNEEAQKHFHQGMALVHAGWDFEAYRHFCEAAKADPTCLMAFYGIALSLAEPNAEVDEVRLAALNRMFDLSEAGFGTEFERSQVHALAHLFSGERAKAPLIFSESL